MKEKEAIDWIKELKGSEEILEFYYAESFIKAFDMAIQALEEVQQYRAIGTPEELQAAMEKQIAKKPIKKERSGIVYCVCGNFIGYKSPKNGKIPFKYCPNCGQKLDWSNENGFLRMAN